MESNQPGIENPAMDGTDKPSGWVVVTGANRGLGLEFVRQLLEDGESAAACCRSPEKADGLHRLKQTFEERLAVLPLDLGDEASLHAGAEALCRLPGGIGLLIHNAGIFATAEEGVEKFRTEEMCRVFQVNLFGPLALTRDLLPVLRDSGKVFILTSRTGALRPPANAGPPGKQFSYACSKAAVHRMVPVLADDLRPRGITVGGIDPGWVRTGMTSGTQPEGRFQLEPDTSVRGMLKVIRSTDLEQTGRLWRWNGERSRWYAPEETPDERQETDA